MAKMINQVKLALLKGMEAVGTSASNMASSAKHRVAEINLETRRREILTEFSLSAFALWQKGEQLPEPLNGMLQELSELDDRLSVLRAQRYAPVENSDVPAPQEEQATPPCENTEQISAGCLHPEHAQCPPEVEVPCEEPFAQDEASVEVEETHTQE